MNKVRVSTVEKVLPYNIEVIWNKITDNENYTWRRDVEKIEQVSENNFIEYGANYQIEFVITKFEFPHIYEFEMHSNIYTGLWRGELIALDQKRTKMIFTETLEFKAIVMKYLSYIMLNLRKIQNNYFADLTNSLKEDEQNG